ncbi:hypothetical protein RRG08_065222 [Elysia crispata]|uniref:Apolipoprotein D n=1 Tax=Elysia crispata TaxID=231223 RepID=A0AAE0YHG3_9GAST|nr:hypothetical protein RRG08_065222 [Elysia crispata]
MLTAHLIGCVIVLASLLTPPLTLPYSGSQRKGLVSRHVTLMKNLALLIAMMNFRLPSDLSYLQPVICAMLSELRIGPTVRTMAAVSSMLFLACALLYLQVSDAQVVIKPGDCPAVVGQSTLDTASYLGTWYEYRRFPAVFELGLDCTSAVYGLAGNGTISVTNGGTIRITLFGKKYVIKRSSIQGNATVPDPSKPAELSVSFGGFSPAGDKPNYFIQETDYENYSVVFSCAQLPGFNVQFAWILTRARGVAPSNLSDLESKLTDAGVDIRPFFTVDQSGCDSS